MNCPYVNRESGDESPHSKCTPNMAEVLSGHSSRLRHRRLQTSPGRHFPSKRVQTIRFCIALRTWLATHQGSARSSTRGDKRSSTVRRIASPAEFGPSSLACNSEWDTGHRWACSLQRGICRAAILHTQEVPGTPGTGPPDVGAAGGKRCKPVRRSFSFLAGVASTMWVAICSRPLAASCA